MDSHNLNLPLFSMAFAETRDWKWIPPEDWGLQKKPSLRISERYAKELAESRGGIACPMEKKDH